MHVVFFFMSRDVNAYAAKAKTNMIKSSSKTVGAKRWRMPRKCS